jgi:protein LSM14
VGTLHEINSETSTVALENVSSFGTESRKTDPKEIIPPSDSVYEYIVFRGSDVKDLRIEETPAARENVPPQVPNDPAILGVSADLFEINFEPARWTRQLCFYVMKYSGC